MIRSFRDKRTRRLWDGERVREFQAFARQAEKRLRVLDAADSLDALRTLRSNRLEAPRGDRRGQYGIRSNDQCRVCFEWREGDAHGVEITDDHD